MLGPTLALLVVFFVLPIGVAAYESFFSWDMLTPPRYVGAANYARARRPRRALARRAPHARLQRPRRRRHDGARPRPRAPARPARGASSPSSARASSARTSSAGSRWRSSGCGCSTATPASSAGSRAPSAPDRSSLLGDPRWALPTLARRRHLEAHRVRDDRLPRGPAGRAALAARGGRARRRRRLGALPSRHDAAPRPDRGLRRDDEPRHELPGLRRRAHHDAGRARRGRRSSSSTPSTSRSSSNLSVGRASALTVVFFVVLLAVAGLQLRVWRAEGSRRDEAVAAAAPLLLFALAGVAARGVGPAVRVDGAHVVQDAAGDRRPPHRAAARAPRPGRLPRGLRHDPGRPLHGRHRLHGGRHRLRADRARAARRVRARQAALRRPAASPSAPCSRACSSPRRRRSSRCSCSSRRPASSTR